MASELDNLQKATVELAKPVTTIRQAHAERLTFKKYSDPKTGAEWYQVETGILWLPPFVHDFWSKAKKKPKPVKCVCECGHRHNKKGV